MIAKKTQIAFLKERETLLRDCREYHKTILRLCEGLQRAIYRYRAMFGIGLLSGLVIGLFMAELIRYISGRL